MRAPKMIVAVLLTSCSAMDVSSGEASGATEEEQLGAVEHELGARLREHFGEGARVQARFGIGDRALVGVTTRAPIADGDVIPAMAIAAIDLTARTVDVVSPEQRFREARRVRDGIALVSEDGELLLAANDGVTHVLGHGVRGDVSEANGGDRFVVTLTSAEGHDGDTRIAWVDRRGEMRLVADALGVDDRPSVSPDGKSLVFVSGRTGVASLYWMDAGSDGTTPPKQITNAHIEAGIERTGDPVGFVPPPVRGDLIEWVSDEGIRYDAGGGELWTVNIRSGEARRVGGAR